MCTRSPGTFTAQAFIINDLDDNQITAFHPGAMNFSHRIGVGEAADVRLGIIAPDGKDGMRAHAAQLRQRPASRSSSIPARGCRCSPATT